MPWAYAQIRSRNRFPVSGSRFPVRICAPIFISRHLRLVFFLSQVAQTLMNPTDDLELCDGINAHNTSKRKKIGEAILEADAADIRRQYGYTQSRRAPRGRRRWSRCRGGGSPTSSALSRSSSRTSAASIRKKIKRGGSTVIWKWKGGYKSAPENDSPIPENDSETGFGRM